ncbi:MAG: hypothetical protein ACPG6P_12055, partial [Akkermansiaceae bacterium]
TKRVFLQINQGDQAKGRSAKIWIYKRGTRPTSTSSLAALTNQRHKKYFETKSPLKKSLTSFNGGV